MTKTLTLWMSFFNKIKNSDLNIIFDIYSNNYESLNLQQICSQHSSHNFSLFQGSYLISL